MPDVCVFAFIIAANACVSSTMLSDMHSEPANVDPVGIAVQVEPWSIECRNQPAAHSGGSDYGEVRGGGARGRSLGSTVVMVAPQVQISVSET